MAKLFTNISDDLGEALAQVATIAGTTKRNVIEAMISQQIGRPHPYRPVITAAWRAYRDRQE